LLFRLSWLFLAVHAAVALLFVLGRAPGTSAAWAGLPLDDSWIHMVYARSLAALHGFAYNPGQQETGATSPLWTALLVPASLVARVLGTSVALPAKLTGVVVAAGTSLAAAGLARALGFGRAVLVATGLAIAFDPGLAFATVSGMEVLLAAGLALLALGQLAHGRYKTAGLVAGLAVLARPEMALLTVMVLGFADWKLRKAQARIKERVLVLVPAVAPPLAWMLFCLVVTGHPLPNTVYRKLASQDFLYGNLGQVFGVFLPHSPWFARGVGFALWGIGAVVLIRRDWACRLVAAFPLLFVVGVAASNRLNEIDAFYWQRYVLPAQAFVVLTLVVGAERSIAWAWSKRNLRWGPAYAVGAALLVLGSVVDLPSALVKRARLYAWNCQNIEELNVAVAVWLRDNIPVDEAIGVNDAGAIRYFGDHAVVDLIGLNNHAILHDRAHASELAQLRTVAIFPTLFPAIAHSDDWTPVHRTTTATLTICRCEQSEIVAYRRAAAAP
jgi:hypothetical protein